MSLTQLATETLGREWSPNHPLFSFPCSQPLKQPHEKGQNYTLLVDEGQENYSSNFAA